MSTDDSTIKLKRCSRCGEEKPRTPEYFTRCKSSKDGFYWRCKSCRHDISRNYVSHKIVSEKRCGQCNEVKPYYEFHRSKQTPDGLLANCKACRARKVGFQYKPGIPAGQMRCYKCKTVYPMTTDFFAVSRHRKSGFGGICKECQRIQRIKPDRVLKKVFRFAPADYHALARSKGIEWIGEMPKTYAYKTLWRCSCGNEWLSDYKTVRATQYPCPKCARYMIGDDRRLTAQDYHNMAKSRGFEWIGELPRNNSTKTLWRCPHGHEWMTGYGTIQMGAGCLECQDMVNGVRVSRQQRYVYEIVGGELNYREGRYSLDIAIISDEYRICIEYDGWHWHKDNLSDDAQRDSALISVDWRILRIKSDMMYPEKQDVLEALSRLKQGSIYQEIILPDWGGR